MNYRETLEYISSVNWKGSVPGLSRITDLMHLLGDPQKELRFIHIGGTNGKGSTAAFTANILQAAGYKTGLYISPFIETFNERMQINGRNISDEELAEIATCIRPYADSLADVPTEFELNTAIALEYFHRNHCDIVVFEVGMGGEFDATNVIDSPEVAVITAIGLDHTAYLGDTLEQIAATKAGIIKPGCQVVLYDQRYAMQEEQAASVTRVIRSRCEEVGAVLHQARPDRLTRLSMDISGQRFDTPYGEVFIPMAAAYQKYNLATALMVIQVLIEKGYSISPQQIREGLAATRWPGRFEILHRDPVFLVDGAHNPQGIAAATESLKAVFPDQKLIMIFGVMADKDYHLMLGQLLPLAKQVYCVTPENPRALPAEDLAEQIRDLLQEHPENPGTEDLSSPAQIRVYACPSIPEAIRDAFTQVRPEDVICAIGSLYMIGDIKTYIHQAGTGLPLK